MRQERTHLENLRLMAFTEGVPEALVARDPQAVQDLLFAIALNNAIQAVIVVDFAGTEIFTLARHPSSGKFITSEESDFSQFNIVSDIMKNDQDAIGDKYAGLLVTSFGPYLFTSAPVRDANGDLLGVLLAGTSLESLLSEVKNQSLADAILLDNEGSFVSTTFVEPETGFGPIEINPGLLDETNPSVALDFNLFGRDYKSTNAALIIRQNKTGILGVALPSNFIVTTVATSRTTFSLIFSAGNIATIVVGYLLAQSTTKPILRLPRVRRWTAVRGVHPEHLRGSSIIRPLDSEIAQEIQRDKKLFQKTFDEAAQPLVAPGSCCGSTETPVYGAFKSTLTFSATQTQTPTTSHSLTQAVLVSTSLTLTITPSLAPSSMPTPTPFDLPSPVPPSVLPAKNEPMMTRSEELRA